MFSGIGCFALGLQRAGMTPIGFIEIDPYCRDVLARHWPGVPIQNDVRTAEFPEADVICGGFPCTDLSRAGKRAGLAGANSGLYRELVRAIRLVRPRYVLLENVAALLDVGMGTVLGDLATVGDSEWIEWDCVPAKAIGACHERDRVWIVAHTNSQRGTCRRPEGTPDGRALEGRETHPVLLQAAADPTPDPADAESSGRGQGRRGSEGLPAGRHTGPQRPHDADTEGDGRGSRRTRRPPDSFAWVRDATRWNAGHTYREGLSERQSERGDPRQERQAAERAAIADVWQSRWPCEPALSGVDDGSTDRLERTKAIGNGLVPQIPELIARAILASHAP